MTEPIGMRVIETPEDDEQTEPLRNPRSGFVAYVPPGAIKKGEALVTTGGSGKTVPAPIATARREWNELMKPVVAKLTNEDFVNIVAYVSSRPMPPASGSRLQTAALR
jgi:hypothetical protein